MNGVIANRVKGLEELPVEDINKLVAERRKRDEKDKELYADLKTKTEQLATSEDALKELDNQRKELGKKQEESGALHLRSELAKLAADELSNQYDAFAEKSRKEVEELTIAEFKKFAILLESNDC